MNSATAGDTLLISGTCTGNFVMPVPLTLLGRGGTLNGAGTGTVLTVDPFIGTVDVNQLVITDGDAFAGGGLYLGSGNTTTLSYDTITGNQVQSGGGGIWGDNNTSISLDHTSVSNNAITGSGGSDEGAGIATSGTLNVSYSSIASNTEKNTNTGIVGGGIYFDAEFGPATIQDSVIADNTSVTTGNARGVGIFSTNGSMTIQSSVIIGNAGSATSGQVDGVGVWSNGITTITNTLVANNTATSSNGLTAGPGILARGTSLSANRDVVIGNVINGPGQAGGLMTIDTNATVSNTVVTGNSASTDGGGIANIGNLTVSASIVAGNRAPIASAIDNNVGTVTTSNSLIVGTCSGVGVGSSCS